MSEKYTNAAEADKARLGEAIARINAQAAKNEAREAHVNEAIAEDVAVGMAAKADAFEDAAVRERLRASHERSIRDQAIVEGAIARQQARNSAFALYLLSGLLVTSLLVAAIWYFGRQNQVADSGTASSAVMAPAQPVRREAGGVVYNPTTPYSTPAPAVTSAPAPTPLPPVTRAVASPTATPQAVPTPMPSFSPMTPVGNGGTIGDLTAPTETQTQSEVTNAPVSAAPSPAATPFSGYVESNTNRGQ